MPELQTTPASGQHEFIAEMHSTEGLREAPDVSEETFRMSAQTMVSQWQTRRTSAPTDRSFDVRIATLRRRLSERLKSDKDAVSKDISARQRELLENTRMLRAVLEDTKDETRQIHKLGVVDTADGQVSPRIMRLAEEYLATARGIWSPGSLATFVGAVQEADPLLLDEVRILPLFLRIAQLQYILDLLDARPSGSTEEEAYGFSSRIHSLRRLNQFDWPETLERFVAFTPVLARDPDNIYARMDEETRAGYMTRVAHLAKHSNLSEVQVAEAAVQLASDACQASNEDDRLRCRKAHVGYYLFEEGLPELAHRIGYHSPAREHLSRLMKGYADDVYIISILLITAFTVAALIVPIVPHNSFAWAMAALFLALLPATQGASDIVNNSVTALLEPRALPKLDFSDGIPHANSTFVVVPTLLLKEQQVRELFEELEARWLANTDPNLHFGLLTDLPDSETRPHSEDRNELVDLAVRLTDELNAKYASEGGGAFLLLHRHRVFNRRQGVWMGWERKRGKLLDLNKLLFGEFDSFPVKAGPTHLLADIRYVITLDSDTQLPKNTAARMIGTIAHPLNRAIIDPRRRIVTRGYGILQPRVAVSVASASRSRLAAIYSGETGFDIYTRAVSDVYQDLFGEGIFTGKGIYEASVLHAVLNRRFPRDVLLSHDLIEGAYARAGLVTDIEVVDDYPSHYSAYTRRKHRWVRGDWQIARWLSMRVPDESGKLGPNPISILSQWKIFDNLRRSLAEPVTFVLLVAGWFVLPGGTRYWTLATLLLMLFPVVVQLLFKLLQAALHASWSACIDAVQTFFKSLGFQLLNLIFLAHQTLLSVDAIVRSLVRTMVTGQRLLEWETAAQAESAATRSSLDLYLKLSPLLALALAGLLALRHRGGIAWAAPILILWVLAPLVTRWLNSPPRKLAAPLTKADRTFLTRHALLIWRFYAEFSTEANHWLIPDHVEEQELRRANTLSPTNLGMLLNARQAALTLGFITPEEFTRATLGTLHTYEQLEKVRGHIYNWIDIDTRTAIPPFTISTVDSGNLLASFYSLAGGTADILRSPLLTQAHFTSLHHMLANVAGVPQPPADLRDAVQWLFRLEPVQHRGEWILQEAERRRLALRTFVEQFMPWLLPRFATLFSLDHFRMPEDDTTPGICEAELYLRASAQRVDQFARAASGQHEQLAEELRALLAKAQENLHELESQLRDVERLAGHYGHAMEFDFLFVKSRQLLSIGYDGKSGELHPACYDLLASEARIATFLAIAKGDIPQRAWFRLGRSHVLAKGRATLLSWTGTMFEYLMPTLWMRLYHDTLISRALDAAVYIQRNHVKGMPWGISESGMARRDSSGRYGYQAWGIPSLALKYDADDGPVISPYSSFLALQIWPDAMKNLRRMARLGWVGEYGFYEAADFTQDATKPELVRSWMAHHHGMSLLAATNLLHKNIVQSWFHANPRVRATELLLHERPLNRESRKSLESVTE